MSDVPTLIYNLRSLARFEHADLSIGDEAADTIEAMVKALDPFASAAANYDESFLDHEHDDSEKAIFDDFLVGDLRAARRAREKLK